MPHYWFSHRANSHLNVPSQWSKADIIQPWPPFPSMAHRDKCSSKQSSLFLSLTSGWWINCSILLYFFHFIDFTEFIYRSCTYEHQHLLWIFYLFFMQGTAWSLVTMLWCQVLSGWKLYNRHLKSKAALWERKDVGGWNKEQNSWVCHKRCKRFEVSMKTGVLHFNVSSSLKQVLCLSFYLQS